MQPRAPGLFARWLSEHEHIDPRYGYVYRYHSRSDAHSVALCQFILDDLLANCLPLREQALAGTVVYGINAKYTWKSSGKTKTLDLAIGTGKGQTKVKRQVGEVFLGVIEQVRIACEAKTVMTEHGKSQPRVFDELASSHEIVHQGDRKAIAAGITVVNIADTFVSPLRQKGGALVVSRHKQPDAAARMIRHLRGLPIRNSPRSVGFDAYATIVVNCDNQGLATLWTQEPAPRPSDRDDYQTFLERISRAYGERFSE